MGFFLISRAGRSLLLLLVVQILAVNAPRQLQGQTLTPEQMQQLREQLRGQPTPGTEPGVTQPRQDPQQLLPPTPLLDRAISRTEYRLGPGDRLTLSIFGFRGELFPLTVTPEGTIIIPTVGIVPVAGLNLEQATQRARQRVRRFYPESEVDVSLAGVRSFRIFVVGAIPEPGLRTATAVTRVSEVVPPADENGVIYRNLTIRRGGETLRVDLARFLRTGDVEFNPFLQEGDIVQVPSIDRTVTIAGEVPYAGTYEYQAGETLADLIQLGNGGQPFLSRAADTLLLMRYDGDMEAEIRVIPRSAAAPGAAPVPLQPFDAVYVPRRAQLEQTTVTVQGEVQRPGRYPLLRNVTTIRELVQMAGGFTPEAGVTAVVLQRRPAEVRTETIGPLANIPPELLTRDERRLLQVISRADENTVLIDLSGQSPAYDLPLQDGDVLFVPERGQQIVVLGAVRRPGLALYQAGQSVDQAVEMVGGYTRRADVGSVVVIRSGSGARLSAREVTSLEPGDRVIVPYRERMPFAERMMTAQGIINTFSGIVLTLVGLERLWDSLSR